MSTLYIIRGLPGSGKSTLGEKLASPAVHSRWHSYAADDWFTNSKTGEYTFNPTELSEAHEDCQLRVTGAMMSNVETICVCNTFSQHWEVEPYLDLCESHNYTPVVLECQNQFGNVHEVPQESIDAMRERWGTIEHRRTRPKDR